MLLSVIQLLSIIHWLHVLLRESAIQIIGGGFHLMHLVAYYCKFIEVYILRQQHPHMQIPGIQSVSSGDSTNEL